MRREVLENMTEVELNIYAGALGLEFKDEEPEVKINKILETKERTADITVFGENFVIPLRRARDKRVSDLLEKGNLTNERAIEVLNLIMGEEQTAKLIDLCVDDDGVQDAEGLGVAIALIMSDDQLKNY